MELTLQPKEYALLEFLLRHPNQPFSAEALMDRVWSSESDASPDTVRLQIMRLRNKIDVEGKESMIRTLHELAIYSCPKHSQTVSELLAHLSTASFLNLQLHFRPSNLRWLRLYID